MRNTVLNVINALLQSANATKVIVLSERTQTCLKVHYNAEKDCIAVSFLDEDATWCDCMLLLDASSRSRGFIASMLMGISY